MAEPARAEVRYTAFLSYSHKDAAAAGRLHRRLESYRMPKRLSGSEGARGPVPDRLWPIFRDREELPAATDLSETVREALAQSGALIILCSPSAAESLWVAEEIETFRKLHPDRPILAAILDGDPPDCFPAALRAFGRDGTWHEPLATDLRPGKDGAHLGLLKLVAGITGVGLDALVQRDAARRIRRVMAVTGAALVAMLIMAALALVALDARREAERQRAEAEGLIEFMLTDLRAQLRGRIGQLDVMQAVNERALAHYGGQDPDRLSDDELTRRARILHAIAEDEVLQGNMQAAQTAVRQAYRTTSAQLGRAPNDVERLFYHAQSEYWLGRIDELNRNWPSATLHYTNYAEAADRLIVIAPGNPDYMMEVAWSAQNLGTVHLEAGDIPTARRLYRKATEWFGRASLARPGDLRAPLEQANVHGWLADTYYGQRDWQGSLDQRQRQYRIVERLHLAEPRNVEIAFRFATAQNGLGRSLDKLGRHQEASRLLREALVTASELTRRDPNNAERLLFRTFIQCQIYHSPQLAEGANRRQFASDIRAATTQLRAQRNPQVESLDRCNKRLN